MRTNLARCGTEGAATVGIAIFPDPEALEFLLRQSRKVSNEDKGIKRSPREMRQRGQRHKWPNLALGFAPRDAGDGAVFLGKGLALCLATPTGEWSVKLMKELVENQLRANLAWGGRLEGLWPVDGAVVGFGRRSSEKSRAGDWNLPRDCASNQRFC